MTMRKLTSYKPNIAGYEVEVTATCKAYEGGGYIERIKFYHVDFENKPTYEELLEQATKCLEDFKAEWLLTKENIKTDLRDYYYVINSQIYTGFGHQTVAFAEEVIS